MPKVLLLTRYERLGASSRVRFLQFLPDLADAGLAVDVRPLLPNAYVSALYGGPRFGATAILGSYLRRLGALAGQRRYDLIWLEKEALPWIPRWLETPLLAGTPYVVDLDDAWFHRYEAHRSPLVRGLLGDKIDAVMRRAAAVVAGNDFLAQRAQQAGARRIEVIPSAIDLVRYPEPPAAPDHGADRPAVIGWIGIPLNAGYLTLIEPALRLAARDGAVMLHVVGGAIPAQLAGIPAERFEWSEATEIERIRAFDIGIMPLDDTPWERGKCAYKLIQVMAAGIPVVASPVGANRDVVRHGVNGFLAATTEEWAQALHRLASDPGLRFHMGQEARRTVAEHYTIAQVSPRLASVLTEAARKRD
jgi:glycosyltransferase involved in cell wall biosynthesis